MGHEAEHFIGLISGTSVDGVDAGLFAFEANQCSLIHAFSLDFPAALRADILALTQPGANEIDRLGSLDVALGEHFARAALALLQDSGFSASQIRAIGSHGQTLRHRPPGRQQSHPFTLQIGDPNTIAQRSGICTVADFRRRDIAAGGHGAPLAPGFHRAVFYSAAERRCILNIGGMCNLSALRDAPEETGGYDTGPGNVLLDAWAERHIHKNYDDNGEWAAGGQSHRGLLDALLSHPYFAQSPPKSTGREDFHIGWLDRRLAAFPGLAARDVQRTLCDLTAISAAQSLKHEAPQAVYVCGGGANNGLLMHLLAEQLEGIRVDTTASLGIPPKWVEAGLCAWLARQTLAQLPGNVPKVTGASVAAPLGGIYWAG